MAPPFQYQPFNGAPYVATIGELLARRGDASAASAQNIGSDIAKTALIINQQRQQAPVLALEQQRLQQEVAAGNETADLRKQSRAQDQAFAALLQQGIDPARAALQTLGPDRGMKVADGYKALVEMQQGQVKDARDSAGRLALGLKSLSPDVQQQMWPSVRASAIKGGLGTEETLPPQLTPGFLDSVIAWSTGKAAKDLMSVNPGDIVIDKDNPGAGPVFSAPAKVTPTSFEQKNVTLDGKPNQLVNYDPHTGQMFVPGSAAPIDPTRIRGNTPASVVIHNQAGASSFPGDFDKTGEDFLSTIPKQSRITVKKIANYEEDPTKVASMRGANREMIMAWVNQFNPAYDQSSFAIRNPTRKAFTTGTQGQQVTAINTAVEHLDLLQQAADALNNGSFKPGNALYNRIRDTFGSAAPSNYQTIKELVDHEVGAVASKGVATVSDVLTQRKLGGADSSPAAIKGYIDTLIPLMGSKLNALHYQYQQAMGPDDPWKPLTPATEAILQRRGVQITPHPDASAPTVQPAPAHAATPGVPFKVGDFTVTVKP